MGEDTIDTYTWSLDTTDGGCLGASIVPTSVYWQVELAVTAETMCTAVLEVCDTRGICNRAMLHMNINCTILGNSFDPTIDPNEFDHMPIDECFLN